MKYKLNEITPKGMQCGVGACPSIYELLTDITPREHQCAAVACPAIYKGTKDITPKDKQCLTCACPSVHITRKNRKEVYLIVGKLINPSEAGLVKKVGKGEALIEVPKGLINKIK